VGVPHLQPRRPAHHRPPWPAGVQRAGGLTAERTKTEGRVVASRRGAGCYTLARRLQARKVDHLQATGAAAVVTANPGCILQIAAGVRERGLAMEVLHLVEVLDRAYAAADGGPA